MKNITFKVQSFRKVPTPYVTKGNTEDTPQMYIALCDVTNLPDNFPMETNPREQNLNTGVAKAIKNSLAEEALHNFYILNRGILLSAASVTHDNNDGTVTVGFEDTNVHGNVDGGHTYAIIKQLKDKITPGEQYVKLEFLTGVEDFFTTLAAARNISVQVDDKSIAELEDRFTIIKDVLENEKVIFDRVKYKQNAQGEIDIAEILQILNLFNVDEYPTNQTENLPIQSYNSKKKCTERYISLHKLYDNTNANPFVKMRPIMIEIFKLYNKLETKMAEFYTEGTKKDNAKSGHYGRVKGVSTGKERGIHTSKFYQQSMDHASPIGFLYPILGAFRSLVVEKDGAYSWRCNPLELLDVVGPELVKTTVDRSRSLGNNPNAVGKDSGNWKTLFMIVQFNLPKD